MLKMYYRFIISERISDKRTKSYERDERMEENSNPNIIMNYGPCGKTTNGRRIKIWNYQVYINEGRTGHWA
jgi:hypothetical protein